ncbi:MAG: hypothetical protein Q8M29_17855 [Bacteroidota bacterium]|nr:hypothetical protein [Bacteroidota bacterium]
MTELKTTNSFLSAVSPKFNNSRQVSITCFATPLPTYLTMMFLLKSSKVDYSSFHVGQTDGLSLAFIAVALNVMGVSVDVYPFLYYH